jgi:hypothetical protein
MTAVLTGDAPARTNGFSTLMNAMTASNVSRDLLDGALNQLESIGYENNPYLSVLRANLALERHKTLSGPGYDAAVTELLTATRERIKLGGQDPADVAAINEQMARIYLGLGDEDEAVRREWVARWAAMTPDERAQYDEGTLVSVNTPGVTSVRATRPTEQKLDDLNAARAKRLAMEAELDAIGAEKPPNADRDDAFNRELDEGVVIEGAKQTKKRSGGGYQPKYKFSRTVVPLRNQARIAGFKRGGGLVDLFNTTMRYAGAARRMRELAEYMRQRDALVSKLDRQHNRPVPPAPEKIREVIRQLIEADVASRDPRRKQEIQKLLAQYRAVLEESRAAWPGQ